MALCKYCGKAFAWGQTDNGRFTPLIPVGEEGDFDRSFQDENGVLRAPHIFVCVNRGGPTVKVVKLAQAVKANEIIGTPRTFAEKHPEKIDPETGEIFSCKVKRKPRVKLMPEGTEDAR